MRVNIAGRVALVTGSGRGIGRAIADRMAREGASVVYSDVVAPVGLVADPRHMAVAIDVTNEAQLGAAVAAIVDSSRR